MSADTLTDTERTIITAASHLLVEKAMALAPVAKSAGERHAVNAALLASIQAEEYLRLLDSIAVPF